MKGPIGPLGVEIVPDPSIPPGEVHFRQNGRTVGKIVGLEVAEVTSGMTFRFPMPINLANARMHWAVKDKTRAAYFATLDTLQAAKHLPPPPTTPLASPAISAVMTLANRMDADNAMARLKWPCDWLQSRGYIVNDKHLKWDGLPVQVVTRSVPSGIEITLS